MQFNSRNKYNEYWAYDIFDKLGDKDNVVDIECAIDEYCNYVNNGIKFRKNSVIKRIITCNINNINASKKSYILSECLKEDALIDIDEFALKRLHGFLDSEQQKRLKETLEKLFEKILFTKFFYVMLKVNDLFQFDVESIKVKIRELSL